MRLLRKIPTAEKVGYHPEYMMELVRKGKFLRPVSRPGSHLVFFVEHEVDEYIAERIAARDAGVTDTTEDDADDQVKETQKAILIRIGPKAKEGVIDGGPGLWHDSDREAHASILTNGHIENHAVRSTGFRDYLVYLYYRTIGSVPSTQALEEALRLMSAMAKFDGPEHQAHLRIAGAEGRIYIDLGDKDWQAIEVTAAGWKVISDPPVRFLRSRGMRPLPRPERGGSIQDLQELCRMRPGDFKLFVAWLLAAFRPRGPYWILCLNGEQGSCKTTLARMARRQIDPNVADTRPTPKDESDLLIAARNGWVINLDNLSKLSDWVSDALCRIATGGGFGTRQLYTNTDEVLFEVKRPIIVNGIPTLATRPDLADRCLVLVLPAMVEDAKLSEDTFWQRFDDRAPEILGVLLDCVAQALQNEAAVREYFEEQGMKLPRMADAALWAEAAAPALGWKPGEIMKLILANHKEVQTHIADGDLVAMAVQRFMKGRDDWEGTSTELLALLSGVMTEDQRKSKEWPKAANSFSNRLRSAAPGIRMSGIGMAERMLDGKTVWSLWNKRGTGKDPTYPTYPSSGADCLTSGPDAPASDPTSDPTSGLEDPTSNAMPKTAELGQILNGKWGKWDKWDRIHTHSYSADSVNPECLEDDPDERDAIQNEPEINLTEIPPMFDRRTPHMTQAST